MHIKVAAHDRCCDLSGNLSVRGISVHEDLGDTTVEYHHQLASASRRVAESLSSNPALEPAFASLLVAGADLQRRMARRPCELRCRTQESTPFPFWVAGSSGHLTEHDNDLFRQSPFGLVEPIHETEQGRFVARLKVCRDQVVLAAKMIVERPFGNAGFLRDPIDADGSNPFSVEQLVGGLDNSMPCFSRAAFHFDKYTDR